MKAELVFEALTVAGHDKGVLSISRAKVPGGWLIASYLFAVMSFKTAAVAFYPDPDHSWDGGSLPLKATPGEAQEIEESQNPFFGRRSK
jgi:hypothetical protein